MGKALVITEKPSVARDIVAALGGFREHEGFWESDEYVVTFSVGHLVELLPPEEIDPVYKRWTLDTLPILPEEFKLRQKPGAAERVRTIKKLLKRDDVDRVINACDAGREGELIFREILEFAGSTKPVERLWLQSMTSEAIREGFVRRRPGRDFDGLGAAAACRSRSDWLIGMNATRALTRRLKGRKEKTAWSAGRVQTPTLAMLVGHELEILSHVPRDYWRIEARFAVAGHEYTGTWFDPEFRAEEGIRDTKDDRIFDEERAREIVEAVQGATGAAAETRRPSRETAPPLFDLTSLQREANRRLGWSARRTLNAAQRCYEAHKVLTYPRTDSRALPSDYRGRVNEVLQGFASESRGRYAEAARNLLERGLENTGRTFDDARVSDHFAIIPTGRGAAGLGGEDARLFDLVARRFLANFHPPAIWNRVERTSVVEGHHFRSRSRTLDEPGWRAVMGQTEQEDPLLPPLVAGESEASDVPARTVEAEVQAERTRPPARITEARLLSLMESAGEYVEDDDLADAMKDKGIGTPATRADIIENLIAKGYLVRVSKGLRPSVKGIRLVDILRRIHAERLASPRLTGEVEYDLREVERGRRTAKQFMDEIVQYTREIVEIAKGFDYEDLYPDDEALGSCPLCSRSVYERSWFYRCKEVPGAEGDADCPFRIWKDKSGRYIDRQTVKTLLAKGEAGPLEGFTTRDGRSYAALLNLDGGELVLSPAQGSESERVSDVPEYEVNEAPLGDCPLGCGSVVIETPTHYICQGGLEKQAENEAKERARREAARARGEKFRRQRVADEDRPCPFVLPRTVCKREITREEAEAYVKDRRTGLLTDFTSRHGRPFAATLFLKEGGRHGFEFAKRTAEPRAAGGPRKPRAAQPPRKKPSRKKSARKKAAGRSSKKG